MSPDPVSAGTPAAEALIVASWDFGDPDGSATNFAELASACTDPRTAALMRTQQARAVGLAGDFASAADLLAGLDVAPYATDPAGLHLIARHAIETGRVRNSTGDPAGAEPFLETAERAATAAGLAGLATDARHMTAIAAGAQGDHVRAIELTRAAIVAAAGSADPAATAWLGSLLNNLGWELFDLGRLDEALEQFSAAVDARLAAGQLNRVAEARWAVGRTLRELGRTDEAIALQHELLSAAPNSGHVLAELAELYRGRDDAAAAEFAAASERILGSSR
ncbi:MAG TPA: tetratricopeptide repeat protein [Micromonosporaceae bacterium]|jgi:tetratricopeptide (TPR) repeat protein